MTQSMQTLLRRIEALEARLADMEGGYSQSMYRMHREVVRTGLTVEKIARSMGLEEATDAEVDAAMDEE